jgi:hypothetical protein
MIGTGCKILFPGPLVLKGNELIDIGLIADALDDSSGIESISGACAGLKLGRPCGFRMRVCGSSQDNMAFSRFTQSIRTQRFESIDYLAGLK